MAQGGARLLHPETGEATEAADEPQYVQPNVLKALAEFDLRPDDILLTSYPGSGADLLKEMVSLICLEGDVGKAKHISLKDRVPTFEPLASPGDDVDWVAHKRMLDELASPRILSTHLKLDQLPPGARQGRCKIFLLVRNPKDTCVSNYLKGEKKMFGVHVTWANFLTKFTYRANSQFGQWWDYVLQYWKKRITLPIQTIYYEECYQQPENAIGKICEALGKQLPTEQLPEMMEYCMMESRDVASSNHRRVGKWKEYFTVAQSEDFDKVLSEKLEDTGLSLKYEMC